ncbi:DUF883 domain-containing protein [Methylibium sp.]|uniref:DUF883 family protein n=1 Tax=Methylibium sp. TaxID=2067992 RepID=UPI0017AA77AC|nr:DUF883 domain-containing protein [Methylibium sp.]MBA3588933.1 DUF883 domain-containing protein [Methylibium sp.]
MMTTSPSLKSRTDAMLNDLGNAAHQAGDSVSAQTDALERRVGAAWAQMRQLEESAAKRARLAAVSTDEYVHEHPWQIILAAAVLGFAAGAMMGSRRRSRRMHVS